MCDLICDISVPVFEAATSMCMTKP